MGTKIIIETAEVNGYFHTEIAIFKQVGPEEWHKTSVTFDTPDSPEVTLDQ